MPYTPNQWVDDDKTRPLSAERLAHAETQYAQAMADVAAQVSDSESAIGAPLYASIVGDRQRAFGYVYAVDYGVTADGTTDDTAALQAFVSYIALNARIGILPAGTIRLTDTIDVPRRPGWQLLGAGQEKTVLKQATDNIAILDLGAIAGTQVHTFRIADMRFTYTNAQPSTNTGANAIVHSQECYWGSYERLTFDGGFYAFKVGSGIGGPWGSVWNDIRVVNATGGVMDWSGAINGVPNNHFGRIFLDGSNMVGPIFYVRGYDFTISNIEFAAIHQGAQLMVFDASTRVEIGAIKLENGTYGSGAAGKALVEGKGNASIRIGQFHIGGNNMVINMTGGKLYALAANTGAGADGAIDVGVIDATYTSLTGEAYLSSPGSNARQIQIGRLTSNSTWNLCDSSGSTAQNRTQLLSAMNNKVSLDRGDANVTLSVGSENIQMFNTALTAARTVTLPASGAAFNGLEFRIVSKGAVNGANTLAVKDGATTIATLSSDNASVRIGFRRNNSGTTREWVQIF